MVNKQAGPIDLLSYIGRQTADRDDWLISGSIPVSLYITNDIYQKIYIYICMCVCACVCVCIYYATGREEKALMY